MTSEELLGALLLPLAWDEPKIAAQRLQMSIATAAGTLAPVLLTRRIGTRLASRNSRMIGDHPLQVWARYPGHKIAFVVTSARGSGVWLDSTRHRVDVYTAKQTFDPCVSDYQMDAYETADAFGYVIGTSEFLRYVRTGGIRWITAEPP